MTTFKALSARNMLLASLDLKAIEAIEPYFDLIDMRQGDVLALADQTPDSLHFPISGIISIISSSSDDRSYEVGMYGREGAGPLSTAYPETSTLNQHVVQADGAALRTSRSQIGVVMAASPVLKDVLNRYVDALAVQIGYTALLNGSSAVAQRLARWLLMYSDRLDGEPIFINDYFLSTMLRANENDVSKTKLLLEDKNLLRCEDDKLTILDHAGLARYAGANYGVPEAEYFRLMGADMKWTLFMKPRELMNDEKYKHKILANI